MTKKIYFLFLILALTIASVYAKDTQYKKQTEREFTVTTIALDAKEERIQSREDSNNTKIQGDITE